MKTLKRICSVILVLAMMLSMVACGEKPSDKETTAGAQDKTTQAADKTEGSTKGEETTEAKEREHVELNLYSYAGIYPGLEETWEAVNKILKEKLNTTVNFHIYTQKEYDSAVGTMISSGADDMDIIFTAQTRVNFDKYTEMNAFLPLEDYREEYLSGSEAVTLAPAWDAVTRDGHLYAVPLPRDTAVSYNFQYNATMVEDLGLTVPEDYNTYLDLVDF